MQARFKGGNPTFWNFTASGAISAGDVIVNNDLILISHADWADGDECMLAVGGGIYEASCNETISLGQALQWDDTLNLAKKDTAGTHTNNLGFALSNDDSGAVEFFHQNGFLH